MVVIILKRIIILLLITLLIIVLCGYIFLQKGYKTKFEKFDYDSGKHEVIKYLENNRSELENIANELYKSKSSKKRPYKNIRYGSYENSVEFPSLKKSEYIQFDMDNQGFLGGQDYGIIYSKNENIYNGKNLFIYDENKETGEGNNIFIREKIFDNWFFYYNDWDGKVQIDNIK